MLFYGSEVLAHLSLKTFGGCICLMFGFVFPLCLLAMGAFRVEALLMVVRSWPIRV